MNVVAIVSQKKKFKKLEAKIRRAALNLLKIKKQKNVYLEIYLVAIMNKNILSFPALSFFPRPDIKQKNLGEIYLNPDYIRHANSALPDFVLQQCESAHANKKRLCGLTYMLLHGLLHLLGYDHKKKNDRIKMGKEERRLLKSIS